MQLNTSILVIGSDANTLFMNKIVPAVINSIAIFFVRKMEIKLMFVISYDVMELSTNQKLLSWLSDCQASAKLNQSKLFPDSQNHLHRTSSA